MMLVNKPITRSKFQQLLKCKEDIRRKPNRFAKKSKSIERTEEIRLLEKSNTIEMATMSSLPPQWVDQYEECSAVLAEISALKKEISVLNHRRLNALREREEEEIDREIYQKKLKSCEKLLKSIEQAKKETPQDERLCHNMCRALLVELQERARDLRSQQRKYLDHRRKLQGATKVTFLELAADQRLAEDYEQQTLEQQQLDLNLDARNKQILKLVESIHGLHEIYKQLSNLVVAQGTILDRIDYNIDQTSKNVQRANQHLGKALQHEKSPIARRCICILLTIIVALGVFLMVKYSR